MARPNLQRFEDVPGDAVMDDAKLRTVWQQRQFRNRTIPLSQPLAILMKHVLAKRVRQLGQLADIWDESLPRSICDHTALESFNRGTLRVIVDSAAYRHKLQMLLRGGLLKEIRNRFSGSLNNIRLSIGQFYTVDPSGAMRYEF